MFLSQPCIPLLFSPTCYMHHPSHSLRLDHFIMSISYKAPHCAFVSNLLLCLPLLLKFPLSVTQLISKDLSKPHNMFMHMHCQICTVGYWILQGSLQEYSNKHSAAEKFVLTSLYWMNMCSRWYTPDLHVVTTDICTKAPRLVSQCSRNQCQVSVASRRQSVSDQCLLQTCC